MAFFHTHNNIQIHSTTLAFDDDDDDNDICPVCDGECTCNKLRPPPPPMSLDQYAPSSSTLSPNPRSPPKNTSLKIKLTVPPNMLGKQKAKTKNTTPTYAQVVQARPSAVLPSLPQQKRRGRPTKAVIAAREAAKAQATTRIQSVSPPPYNYQYNPKNVPNNKRKKSGSRLKSDLKANRPAPKRIPKRKRRVISDDDGESSLSNLTDFDSDCDDDDDDDVQSIQFPTFVSASALSSLDSNSSSSSSSSESSDSDSNTFESDSEIQQEEEIFIVSDVHEKARVRRELLGDESRRNQGPHGDWVIRPRKKSVGPDEVDMDVDSDATEDEEEKAVDEEEEETDGRGVGGGYAGLVTAWSDDEESNFDADIFFANLTDSEQHTDSSCSANEDEGGEDGDHSDMDTVSNSDTAELMTQRHELENLQLEVTEGWDGQIVFTNGFSDGKGILDIDFEVDASHFTVETSPSLTHDSDMDMSASGSISSDEDGYMEDADGGDGDTTDEELVGEDELPNERAMKLFSLPFNVSAIDPLSTVSPAVSPAPRRRIPFGLRSGLDSPKPEDILYGRVFWNSDEHDYDDMEWRRARSSSRGSSRSQGPRTGVFIPVQETRQAIIDGSKEVPSPHPRFNRRRGRSNTTRLNVVEQILRKRLLNSKSTPSFTTASELLSPLQLLPSESDFGSPSPCLPMAMLANENELSTETINLDDVLEASFLAPDSLENSDNTVNHGHNNKKSDEDDKLALSSGRHIQNLNRWDLISVGAFRQTRENAWSSDCTHTPHSSVDYGNIMKASPLSAIMWQKEKKEKEREEKEMKGLEIGMGLGRGRGRKRKEPIKMAISPVILPNDGDRTPTGSSSVLEQGNGYDVNMEMNGDKNVQKTRKETRRERKLKKKSWGPAHHQQSHHQQWHTHQHHPNLKSRGSAAMQRLGSVPPFNL